MTYSLYLAHINDTHSHFEPSLIHFSLNIAQQQVKFDAYCGGYAAIETAVTQQHQRAEQEKILSLFLHAGDSFQGSLYFSRFQGRANAHLLNLLQPDAMTIGNHEFDLGNTPVANFIAKVPFPVLAGNMDLSQEDQKKEAPLRPLDNLLRYDNKRQIAQYLLKPLADKQLAIFGITIDQMAKIGCPDPDCLFLNAIETARATVEHLQANGIVHIIILSHLGYQGDLELATQVDGISAIVGGHTHTLSGDFSELGIESTEIEQQMVNDTAIFHAGKHAESIGMHKLTFNADGKIVAQDGGISFLTSSPWQENPDQPTLSASQRQSIDQTIETSKLFTHVNEDQYVSQIINSQYRPAIAKMRNNIVTHLNEPLRHTRLPTEELPDGSEIAPLVSAAFFASASKSMAIDFALHNAGGVRVSLKSGPLSEADICGQLLPFEIHIVSYNIHGRDLYLALEGAINNATNNGVDGTGDGSYPYCHHLRFSYQAELAPASRLSSLEIKKDGVWQDVQPDSVYRGVSSAYTVAGKEGYDAILNAWGHVEHPVSMSGSFMEYAKTLS